MLPVPNENTQSAKNKKQNPPQPSTRLLVSVCLKVFSSMFEVNVQMFSLGLFWGELGTGAEAPLDWNLLFFGFFF